MPPGYFLSYLFRTVNAVIGPVLARELGLADNALGLLTSTYFLAFGAAQLPLGMLLDRYGPRRVESGLLLLAGARRRHLCHVRYPGRPGHRPRPDRPWRIGLLDGFLQGLRPVVPPERQASLTGWVMASGGLGALAASKPLEIAMRASPAGASSPSAWPSPPCWLPP